MRIHLHDQLHSVSKYIVVVNSSLEFTIFVFNGRYLTPTPYIGNKKFFKVFGHSRTICKDREYKTLRGIDRGRCYCCCNLTQLKILIQTLTPLFGIQYPVNRAARKKSKASATSAKPKASLTACGPEKLRATVKSTRLQVKDLEDRLQELQC